MSKEKKEKNEDIEEIDENDIEEIDIDDIEEIDENDIEEIDENDIDNDELKLVNEIAAKLSAEMTKKSNQPINSLKLEKNVEETQQKAQKKEEKTEKERIEIKNYRIPTEPVWHVKRTKTGFTLPKSIREKYESISNYALLEQDGILTFYPIYDEDVVKLNLINKPKGKSNKNKKRTRKYSRRKKKTKVVEGPQPEWGNYFLYEFEDQDKLKEVLEIAFDKFAENPPNVQEGMEKIKYALVAFIKNIKMNDSRLRQSIAFFLLDIVDKFNIPNLIDFVKDKILPEIKSRFLYQLTLTQLIYYSFKTRRFEKAKKFIEMFIEDVSKYTISEAYALMDSYKKLVTKLTKNVSFLIPQEYLIPIKEHLKGYINQLEEDYKIQIIELLGRLNFIDDTVEIGENILKNLPEESPTREDLNSLLKELRDKSI
ncbi:MAG: hypothetical protein ACTSRZ_12940 [Promethearchaeota archaeon]